LAISVRTLESSDSMKVLAIYSEAIKGPDATLETNVPTWSEWSKAHLPTHRLVAVDDAKKFSAGRRCPAYPNGASTPEWSSATPSCGATPDAPEWVPPC